MPKTKESAKAGLALDPNLSEAHIALAQALFSYDRDYSGAESEFRKALAINPSSALAREYFGYFLMVMGRQSEAREQLDQALKLDPMSSLASTFLGGTYFYDREWSKAEAAFAKAISLDPGNPMAELLWGWTLDRKGEPAQAESHIAKALASGSPWVEGYQGFRAARQGRDAEAQATLKKLDGPGLAYLRAMVLAGLRRNDDALKELKRAMEDHEEGTTTLMVDPTWDDLRADPRFRALSKLSPK